MKGLRLRFLIFFCCILYGNLQAVTLLNRDNDARLAAGPLAGYGGSAELYRNPAVIGYDPKGFWDTSLTYANLFAGISLLHLNGLFSSGKYGAIGGGLSRLNYPSFTGINEFGAETGTVTAAETLGYLSYGISFWKNTAVGGSIKAFRSELASYTTQSAAADGSLIQRLALGQELFFFSVAFRNLGKEITYANESEPLPREISLNLSWQRALGRSFRILAGLQSHHLYEEWFVRPGLELRYRYAGFESAIRSNYSTFNQLHPWQFGGGVGYTAGGIHYEFALALAPNNTSGNNTFITLAVSQALQGTSAPETRKLEPLSDKQKALDINRFLASRSGNKPSDNLESILQQIEAEKKQDYRPLKGEFILLPKFMLVVYRPSDMPASHLIETREGSVLPGEIIQANQQSLKLRSRGSDLEIPWEYIVNVRDRNLE